MEEVVFPDWIFTARFAMDVVCLAVLSVGDIKDIYLFGRLITGWTALVYRKTGISTACNRTSLLLVEIIKHFGAGSDRVMELHQKVEPSDKLLNTTWQLAVETDNRWTIFWEEKG